MQDDEKTHGYDEIVDDTPVRKEKKKTEKKQEKKKENAGLPEHIK
jgi:hypothetical protein